MKKKRVIIEEMDMKNKYDRVYDPSVVDWKNLVTEGRAYTHEQIADCLACVINGVIPDSSYSDNEIGIIGMMKSILMHKSNRDDDTMKTTTKSSKPSTPVTRPMYSGAVIKYNKKLSDNVNIEYTINLYDVTHYDYMRDDLVKDSDTLTIYFGKGDISVISNVDREFVKYFETAYTNIYGPV